MREIGVTGVSRELDNAERLYIARILLEAGVRKGENVRVITGGATGVDTLATVVAWLQDIPVDLHVPILKNGEVDDPNMWNVRLRAYPKVMVFHPEPKHNRRGDAMMQRNDSIVASLADDLQRNILLAFPNTSKPKQRSGTWSTIRRAEKARVYTAINPLSKAR